VGKAAETSSPRFENEDKTVDGEGNKKKQKKNGREVCVVEVEDDLIVERQVCRALIEP
jgi:hypothetical protein